MGKKGRELTGLAWFGICIMDLIDNGETESLNTILNKMESGVLVSYILKKYKMNFSKTYNINALNSFFENEYESAKSSNSFINNDRNGLLAILAPILWVTEGQITKWD